MSDYLSDDELMRAAMGDLDDVPKKTTAPVNPPPQTRGPQTVGPQTRGPQAGIPGGPGPQTVGPQTRGPQAGIPGGPSPQTRGPQAGIPGGPGPQTRGPQAGIPGGPGPQTRGPQTRGPQAGIPGGPGPQTVGPQTRGPQAGIPGGPGLQTAQPEKPKGKKGAKIAIIIIVIVLVLAIAAALGWYFFIYKQSNNTEPVDNNNFSQTDDNSADYDNNDDNSNSSGSSTTASSTETINLRVPLTPDGYVDKYIVDGVVELSEYSATSYSRFSCIELDDYYNDNGSVNNRFVFAWKNANEVIPKISRNSAVGINSYYDEIRLTPVKTTPFYCVPMNFFVENNQDFDSVNPDVRPLIAEDLPTITGDTGFINHHISDANNQDFVSDITGAAVLGEYTGVSSCNGTPINDYVASNSTTFLYDNLIGQHVIFYNDGFKLITGSKNEEFVFEADYYGTPTQITTHACVEAYKLPAPDKNEDSLFIYIEAQESGDSSYNLVDFSNLEPGVYFIETFQSFVEIV